MVKKEMSSKYRSRIKLRKPRKLRGGGVHIAGKYWESERDYLKWVNSKKKKKVLGGGIAEAVEKAPEVIEKVQRTAEKAYKVAKAVQPAAKKVGKEGRKLYKGLSAENVAHSKDIEDFTHRSFHSYHHAHAFV